MTAMRPVVVALTTTSCLVKSRAVPMNEGVRRLAGTIRFLLRRIIAPTASGTPSATLLGNAHPVSASSLSKDDTGGGGVVPGDVNRAKSAHGTSKRASWRGAHYQPGHGCERLSPGRHTAGYSQVLQQFHGALFTVRANTQQAKRHTNHAPAQWVLSCILQLGGEFGVLKKHDGSPCSQGNLVCQVYENTNIREYTPQRVKYLGTG